MRRACIVRRACTPFAKLVIMGVLVIARAARPCWLGGAAFAFASMSHRWIAAVMLL